jgi:hypothetical protein
MLHHVVAHAFALQHERDRPGGQGRRERRAAFAVEADAPVPGFRIDLSARARLTTRTHGTTSSAPEADFASVPDLGGHDDPG